MENMSFGKFFKGLLIFVAVIAVASMLGLFGESAEETKKKEEAARKAQFKSEFMALTPEMQEYWTKHGPPPKMGQEMYRPNKITGNWAVQRKLEQLAKDPDSLVIEGMDGPHKTKDGWAVRCWYRAKNSFGGYVKEAKWFVFNYGIVVAVKERDVYR
jgi:hypothetical protein